MVKHIHGLYQIIQSSSAVDKLKNWNEVEARIKVQIPLRLLSCVQLASKLSSNSKVNVLYTKTKDFSLPEAILQRRPYSNLSSVVHKINEISCEVSPTFGHANTNLNHYPTIGFFRKICLHDQMSGWLRHCMNEI